MANREKVVKGLECCKTTDMNFDYDTVCGDSHNKCPYREPENEAVGSCLNTLINDALALLKAQEPRVMTVIEVDTWVSTKRIEREPIVIEVRDRYIAWIVGDEYGDLPGANLSREFYGKIYRCWTSRPDEKRRAETPWE